jgi:hypothetical protein
MELEGSLPSSQQPATGPYPEPDESNPRLHTLEIDDWTDKPYTDKQTDQPLPREEMS